MAFTPSNSEIQLKILEQLNQMSTELSCLGDHMKRADKRLRATSDEAKEASRQADEVYRGESSEMSSLPTKTMRALVKKMIDAKTAQAAQLRVLVTERDIHRAETVVYVVSRTWADEQPRGMTEVRHKDVGANLQYVPSFRAAAKREFFALRELNETDGMSERGFELLFPKLLEDEILLHELILPLDWSFEPIPEDDHAQQLKHEIQASGYFATDIAIPRCIMLKYQRLTQWTRNMIESVPSLKEEPAWSELHDYTRIRLKLSRALVYIASIIDETAWKKADIEHFKSAMQGKKSVEQYVAESQQMSEKMTNWSEHHMPFLTNTLKHYAKHRNEYEAKRAAKKRRIIEDEESEE